MYVWMPQLLLLIVSIIERVSNDVKVGDDDGDDNDGGGIGGDDYDKDDNDVG